MATTRSSWRILIALLVIAHGWAHAVLPLRGLFDPETLPVDFIPVILYGTAMLGFTAAGLGLLGIWPLTVAVRPLLVVAGGYSLAALVVLGQSDLWWGGVIDAALMVGGLSGTLQWRPFEPARPARRWMGHAVALLFFAYTSSAVAWPVYRTWGTRPEEHRLTLLGDQAGRQPSLEIQHSVTVNAAPEAVWPWLAQLGQDRAGFYSYDWLERLFGADIHNSTVIRPEWQHRDVGELVRATQPDYLGGVLGPNLGWPVQAFEPNRALVLQYWGTFALIPLPDGSTRFVIRTAIGHRQTPVWAAALDMLSFQLPHFIMERRMMLRIKALAESTPAV
jgi:hypothetical protein